MKRIAGFLFVLLVLAALTACEKKPVIIDEPELQGEIQQQAVMAKGKLYYNTGQLITVPRCGVMDGEITATVSEYRLPAEDNQSNFGTGYEYQYVDENHIDIPMGDSGGWTRFCTGECKQWHGENLCGVPTPPPDHVGSWFCMPATEKKAVSNLFTEEIWFLSDDETAFIKKTLENGNWENEGTADCINNVEFVIEGETYRYHSDCGTFNDNVNQRSLTLDINTKDRLNAILSEYISISSE